MRLLKRFCLLGCRIELIWRFYTDDALYECNDVDISFDMSLTVTTGRHESRKAELGAPRR